MVQYGLGTVVMALYGLGTVVMVYAVGGRSRILKRGGGGGGVGYTLSTDTPPTQLWGMGAREYC